MADEADLKSAGSNVVWVQVPSPAPIKSNNEKAQKSPLWKDYRKLSRKPTTLVVKMKAYHDKETERLNNSEIRQALKNVLYNGFWNEPKLPLICS